VIYIENPDLGKKWFLLRKKLTFLLEGVESTVLVEGEKGKKTKRPLASPLLVSQRRSERDRV